MRTHPSKVYKANETTSRHKTQRKNKGKTKAKQINNNLVDCEL